MANTHKTLTALFSAIADAIRAKTGSTAKIVADDFPSAIASISTGTGTAQPTLQKKTVVPKATSQTVSPDTGYDGLSSVTITGDSNLVSGNIKSGVTIFNVSGSYTGTGGNSGGSSGDYASGSVTIDADTDKFTIETGLASISTILVVRTEKLSETGSWGWVKDGSIDVSCYTSGGTYAMHYCSFVSKLTDQGNGSVQVSQYATASGTVYPITAGTYNWTARSK